MILVIMKECILRRSYRVPLMLHLHFQYRVLLPIVSKGTATPGFLIDVTIIKCADVRRGSPPRSISIGVNIKQRHSSSNDHHLSVSVHEQRHVPLGHTIGTHVSCTCCSSQRVDVHREFTQRHAAAAFRQSLYMIIVRWS